jgi:hypothetical protein
MHFVYLTNDTVTDQSQIDPFSVFNSGYAVQFIEAPDEVTFGWRLVDRAWVAPETPQPTPESIIQSIVTATQKRLDDFARTRNYDGILSLCTYATSTVPKFQAEGQYGVTARDATWAQLYEIMAEVEAGIRPMPEGYSDIESELPVLAWPI